MKTIGSYKKQNQGQSIPAPVEKAPTFEPSITAPAEPLPIYSIKKLTEYKQLVADSYQHIGKVSNQLLADGYEVKFIVPAMSGRVVVLGGK